MSSKTIAIVTIGLTLSAKVHADSVRMRQAVRVSEATPEVHLTDIASLEGDAAQALGEVVIAKLDAEAPLIITVDAVRDALTKAGANWGIINLSGRTTTVRATWPPVTDPAQIDTPGSIGVPQAMVPIELKTRPATIVEVDSQETEAPVTAARWVSENTVRGLIVTRLLGALNVDPSHLQVEFEPGDTPLLDRELTTGRFEVEPISHYDGPRVELVIREWSPDARPMPAPTRHAITVTLLLRCETVTPIEDINRGDMMTDEQLTTLLQWLPPDRAAMLAVRESVVGRVAAKRMHEGEAVRQRDIEQEALLKRGDLVIVRCLVGGHVISFKAEARTDGALGEEIAFRRVGERADFLARVAGPGEAMVDLNQ